ncbi:TetR/AcrR family transcriptional regulator [Halomonas sp. PR-M31]|uniref:TetR/AcrR family transcriptional regulator n=1 Tax=Halomonas sp. PR-M31 TaxID=1471202 RepID=UPI0006507A52|nr:TetR/AcrR family transcriptional regulator [Halomonas sp. PR-M31]
MNDTATRSLDSPKARQILKGAKATFLEFGYEGASTDEIVRRAGVSKGTMYNYFPDKRALFTAVIEEECSAQANRLFELASRREDTEATLREIAHKLVALLLSPSMQDLYRLAVSEAVRFPELARSFYDSGPDLGTRRLSQFLAAAVARNELAIDDVELAAHQFDQLCKADIFYKRLFGIRKTFDQAELDRIAKGAVDMFLKAYRP